MRKKILITVKTYPTLSTKYKELVCTAGITEDGKWVRIYPIPFRRLENELRYQKYQWVEMDLERNTADPRPESHRLLNIENIRLYEKVSPDNFWKKRKDIVLKNVYTDINKLISDAKEQSKVTSLAVFKPKKILDFVIENTEREWDKKKLASLDQMELFNDSLLFEAVRKLPYKFSYVFIDENNKKSKLMIEDWEIGQLYWNCLATHAGDEDKALNDVRKKYLDSFVYDNHDISFFLGTTREFHFIAKNPFIIIGVFYPKVDNRLQLF